MFKNIFLQEIFVLTLDFLSVGFGVVFNYIFTINFLSCYFHIDLICQIFYDKRIFIKSKIFCSCSHKSLFVTDDFSIKSVYNRVGLFQKAIDSADLLKIFFPFRWMLNNNSKIDIFIFCFDSTSDFLALIMNVELRKLCQYCLLNLQLCNYSFFKVNFYFINFKLKRFL